MENTERNKKKMMQGKTVKRIWNDNEVKKRIRKENKI